MKRAITLKSPSTTANRKRDPDNPPWTEAMLGPAVVRRGRGPQKAPVKVSTTIRIDADVLEYFRAGGPGYQTRMNEVLRAAKERAQGAKKARERRVR